ncbi:hypothetical protein EIP91_010566 [Steccherinum ochraceum]|uniref:NAD(P)-binding protein n=1 Tax=Steccherinum ochraceum TaxID=92696 RepID=A0A4R0RIU3_9APHY|nr:hypothetical protein EIP91_010566 [Steccherinum ochraceum]
MSSAMTASLTGKVALVTGASRGIGACVARRLALEGAIVVVNYVSNAEAAMAVVDEINNKGPGRGVAVKADLSDVEAGKWLVEETFRQLGKLDILVLNAGLMDLQTLDHISEEQYEKHFNINVKVPLFMAKHAAQHLKSGGRIIFFSTSLTMNTNVPPNYLLYVATKGAIQQITRVLAKDLGSKGITVNCVAPGPTDTDLFRHEKSEALIKQFESFHPMKRIGRPDEMAPIVATLAREESSWVNGQTWFVNGGFNV